jgi:hypothetical protein
MWIGLILAGGLVGAASMVLVHQLAGTFDPVLFPGFKGASIARQIAVDISSLIVRVSISFCFGSFLAALLYRNRHSASPSTFGLGSEINERQI